MSQLKTRQFTPSPADLQEAAKLQRECAGKIPNGPAFGALTGSHGMYQDLVLYTAFVANLVRSRKDRERTNGKD